MTWPLFKVCEGHVVLMGLTILAGLAVVDAAAWLMTWRWSVRGLMVLAPGLATLRVARAVRRGTAEAEFTRWFQPIGAPPSR